MLDCCCRVCASVESSLKFWNAFMTDVNRVAYCATTITLLYLLNYRVDHDLFLVVRKETMALAEDGHR